MNRSRARAFLAATLLATSTMLAASRSEAQTADELSQQAFDKYQAADYPSAVALYMKAYEQSVDARILFNIAQIYDKKVQDRDLAIEFYRRYLKSTTTEPELVAKSTARIAELTRQQQAKPETPAPAAAPPPASGEAASPPPPPPAAPPPAEESSPPFFIGWIVTGTLAAGAIVTGSLALEASAEVRDATYQGDTPPDDVQSSETAASTLAGVTDALIAGAVLAGGITLVLQLTHDGKAEKTGGLQLRPLASHTGGGAVVRGGF